MGADAPRLISKLDIIVRQKVLIKERGMIDEDESLFVEGPGGFDYYGDEENAVEEPPAPAEVNHENAEVVEDKTADAVNYPRAIKPKREVTLALPLHFQHKIVSNMLAEDGLLVLARGLGLPSIVANLLFHFDIAGTDNDDMENSLVFILNSNDGESERLREEMRQISVVDSVYTNGEHLLGPSRPHRGLSIITDKIQQEKRKEVYSQGGVFSVTSRILARDMLSEGIIDRGKITAMVVLNAHKVTEYSLVAFILRLLRESNKAATIKAFSDQPEKFGRNFSPLATQLKFLRLNKTWLWPRFHIKVKEELMEKNSRNGNNTVHEIMVEPTSTMQELSQLIRGCIQSRLSELKRLNPNVDSESWSIDNIYQTNFVGMIMIQLSQIWHLISWTSKNIIYDLATLKELLDKSTEQDAVSFLKDVVFTYNNGELAARRNNNSWVLLEDAYHLLNLATQRVFGSQKLISQTPKDRRENIPIEQVPKWDQLSRVLEEIQQDDAATKGPILIKCKSPKQLADYLKAVKKEDDVYSAQDFLKKKRREYQAWRKQLPSAETLYNRGESGILLGNKRSASTNAPTTAQIQNNRGFNKRRRVRGGSKTASTVSTRGATPSEPETIQVNEADTPPTDEPLGDNIGLLEDEFDNDNEEIQILSQNIGQLADVVHVLDMENVIMIERYDDLIDPVRLRELRPAHIIMYEPNQSFVRHVEVYRASNSDRRTELYHMVYKDSVEETKYLSELEREKRAFTKLIKEKAQMPKVIHDDDDPGTDSSFLRTISTRHAGGQRSATAEQPRVIVDSREFTELSSLPFLLHLNKIKVVPMTLNVGDYIITDRICVERKTVSDLVQSFSNGRLFEQCANMFKFYECPVLLLEFDQAKSFSMEPFSEDKRSRDSARLAQEQVQQNLALLLQHYPRLKIIWSMSPDHAAKILVDLKMDAPEPDVETSRLYGSSDPGAIENAELENETAIRMLQSIPGINYRNYVDVINNVPNLETFCEMSEEEIAEMIGSASAKKVYQFFHQSLKS